MKTVYCELQVYYSGRVSSPDTIAGQTGELVWRERLAAIKHRAAEIGQTTGGFSGDSSFTDPSAVIAAVEGVGSARREYDIYLSLEVHAAVDRFLETALKDISEEF